MLMAIKAVKHPTRIIQKKFSLADLWKTQLTCGKNIKQPAEQELKTCKLPSDTFPISSSSAALPNPLIFNGAEFSRLASSR